MNRYWGRPGPSDWTRDTKAVSEIIGTLALVGVTVVTVAGFALYMATLPQPEADAFVTLDAKASRGGTAWGDGDERIILRHLGGDPLPAKATQILVEIDGTTTNLSGSDLGAGFSDGALAIGEEWSTTLRVPEGASLAVFVVVEIGRAETLIFSAVPELVA